MTTFQIPTPCAADWNGMNPSGDGRHCATCGTTVVDLLSVTPIEEQRLLARMTRQIDAGARICVHARTNGDGFLMPPPRRRRLLTNGLAGIMAVAIAGCTGSGPTTSATTVIQPAPAVSTSPGQPPGSAPSQAATGAPDLSASAPAPVPAPAPAPALPTNGVPMVHIRITGMLVRPPASGANQATGAPTDTRSAEPVAPQAASSP